MHVKRLKIVWKLAISPLEDTLPQSSGQKPALRSSVRTIINTIVPIILKRICTIPVRFDSAFVPMEQTIAVVTHVPMLQPMIRG